MRKNHLLTGIILFVAAMIAAVVPAGADTMSRDFYQTVYVEKGYLALRNAKGYDDKNEIGELYNGDLVKIIEDSKDSDYAYVYSPMHDLYGFVNKNYVWTPAVRKITGKDVFSVIVPRGYLALRSAPGYDYGNELASLYSMDEVIVQNTGDGKYWYVYSPSLDMYGYVDSNYLYGKYTNNDSTDSEYTVQVSDFLALRSGRSAKSDMLAQLHQGDKVVRMYSDENDFDYVYVPSLNMYGYVSREYIVKEGVKKADTNTYGPAYTVDVEYGYLALRSEAKFSDENEIGRLLDGEIVYVKEYTENYWYVYSPRLDMYGYADSRYLV